MKNASEAIKNFGALKIIDIQGKPLVK